MNSSGKGLSSYREPACTNRRGAHMGDSHNEVIRSGTHLVEALAGTFAAITSGYAEFHQEIASQSHRSIAVGLTAAKEVLTLKSPYDWNEVQMKWACEFIGATAVNAAHV